MAAGPEQDLGHYASSLMERFANPALQHRLEQIAMDGSQKIPQRWLETLAGQARRGRSCPAILQAMAAWLRHVRQETQLIEDPLAEKLRELWRKHGSDEIAHGVLAEGGFLASAWRPSGQDFAVLSSCLASA